MKIHLASPDDLIFLRSLDHHISADMLADKIDRREVFVAKIGPELVAWLRFGYFWDNIPFMNLLFVLEKHRGQDIGRQLVLHWENAMQTQGFDQVFTSTLADESAQHFYRKLGYSDCGSLFLPGEAVEIILRKPLKSQP
jgi:GNAT superfamily N-acetyltransferase